MTVSKRIGTVKIAMKKPKEFERHKPYIEFFNGMIINITDKPPPQLELPNRELIHKISKDRHELRSKLTQNQKCSIYIRTPPTEKELLKEILEIIER